MSQTISHLHFDGEFVEFVGADSIPRLYWYMERFLCPARLLLAPLSRSAATPYFLRVATLDYWYSKSIIFQSWRPSYSSHKKVVDLQGQAFCCTRDKLLSVKLRGRLMQLLQQALSLYLPFSWKGKQHFIIIDSHFNDLFGTFGGDKGISRFCWIFSQAIQWWGHDKRNTRDANTLPTTLILLIHANHYR